jgi:hypothetical protein
MQDITTLLNQALYAENKNAAFDALFAADGFIYTLSLLFFPTVNKTCLFSINYLGKVRAQFSYLEKLIPSEGEGFCSRKLAGTLLHKALIYSYCL